MATWREFESSAPQLAATGMRLIEGAERTVHLATVRADGSPQVHPVVVYSWDGRLWTFIVEMTSKNRDLRRDGRFALHTMPGGQHEEFHVSGSATLVADSDARTAVAQTGKRHAADWEILYELSIDRVLVSRWDDWGLPTIRPTFWRWSPARGVSQR